MQCVYCGNGDDFRVCHAACREEFTSRLNRGACVACNRRNVAPEEAWCDMCFEPRSAFSGYPGGE